MEGYSVNEEDLFKNENDYEHASSESSLIKFFQDNFLIENSIISAKITQIIQPKNDIPPCQTLTISDRF